MNEELTPYDTGARAEPHPWMQLTPTGGWRDSAGVPATEADFGKVDFDDDEGATVATVWLQRDADGRYSIHVVSEAPVRIVVDQ